MKTPKIISVLVECDGRKYRVIDNLRSLVGGGPNIARTASEAKIGRKVLDLARQLEVAEPAPTELELDSILQRRPNGGLE